LTPGVYVENPGKETKYEHREEGNEQCTEKVVWKTKPNHRDCPIASVSQSGNDNEGNVRYKQSVECQSSPERQLGKVHTMSASALISSDRAKANKST
jgi:hypothetical protein